MFYDVNDFRVKRDYDAVWPAFAFDIADTAGDNAINWSPNFGMMRFDDMVLEGFSSESKD